MKTIFAICLLTASFALIPSADAAVCDPVTGAVCAGSYAYGTCDNGGAGNYANLYSYDATTGYNAAGASTFCYGYPPYYSGNGVSAGATSCDPSWTTCTWAGASWSSYEFFGSPYCDTSVYAFAGGQYNYQSLGCPAGGPPEVPALLP